MSVLSPLLKLRFYTFPRLQWTVTFFKGLLENNLGTAQWHNRWIITWDCPWHAWRAKYHRWAAGLPFREQAEEMTTWWNRDVVRGAAVGKPRSVKTRLCFYPLPGKGDDPFVDSCDEMSRSLSYMYLTGSRPVGDVYRAVSVATNKPHISFPFLSQRLPVLAWSWSPGSERTHILISDILIT